MNQATTPNHYGVTEQTTEDLEGWLAAYGNGFLEFDALHVKAIKRELRARQIEGET